MGIIVSSNYSTINSNEVPLNVTGFAKRGLPHTSNLPTLTNHNFRLEGAIALQFSQKRAIT